MAFGLTEQETQDYKRAFDVYDKNADGTISIEECGPLMKDAGHTLNEEELQAMVQELDANGNGKFDFSEFVAWREKVKKADTIAVFKSFDKDGNGFISSEELREGYAKVGLNVSPESADEMIKKADTNGDGRINYMEFVENMY